VNGELRIDVSGLDLERLITRVDAATPAAVGLGMEHIHQVSAELVPVETGRLVGSGAVHVDGDTAALTYDGPYARYQHERLDLHHEHGQAKFLEQPVTTEQDTALAIVARRLKEAL
jgi:hypothetical protein